MNIEYKIFDNCVEVWSLLIFIIEWWLYFWLVNIVFLLDMCWNFEFFFYDVLFNVLVFWRDLLIDFGIFEFFILSLLVFIILDGCSFIFLVDRVSMLS